MNIFRFFLAVSLLFCCSVCFAQQVLLSESAFGAIDEKTHHQCVQMCVRRDETGIRQLIAAGRVREIAKGTIVNVVTHGIASSLIRMDDGTQWWIPAEFVSGSSGSGSEKPNPLGMMCLFAVLFAILIPVFSSAKKTPKINIQDNESSST